MLLMRPGTAWLILYCSGSRMRSILRYGEPGGYRVTTTPPGKMGCGANGASVAGPGLGTPRGAGSGGSEAGGAFCAPAAHTTAKSRGRGLIGGTISSLRV